MLEKPAREGAVLVEVRFGAGAGLGPRHMSLFREAERRVRMQYPYFYTEAIAVIRLSTVSGPEAFETCLRARDQGLAGIDFLPAPYDSEADWTEAYVWAERATEAGLGITTHAGEFSTANLAAALGLPGLTRIGHGVHAADDADLLEQLVDRAITVECCLTSNVVFGAVESLEAHPIRALVEAGVPVTLSTDDPMRVCTGIGREYDLAARLGFSEDDLLAFTRAGIAASFTTDERRAALLRTLDAAG